MREDLSLAGHRVVEWRGGGGQDGQKIAFPLAARTDRRILSALVSYNSELLIRESKLCCFAAIILVVVSCIPEFWFSLINLR